jgi:hypothetical protein
MFFVLWGFKRYVTTLAMLTLVCGDCQMPAAHPLRQVTTKFTLFFVPLFATSKKFVLQCTYCGQTHMLTQENAGRLLASPPEPGSPFATTPRSDTLAK